MEYKENTKFAADYIDAVERKLRLRKRKQIAIVLALVACLPLLGLTMLFAGPKKYVDGNDISVTYEAAIEEDKNIIVSENELALLTVLVAEGKVNGTELEQLLAAHGVTGKNPKCVQTSGGYIQLTYELSGREYTLGMNGDLSGFTKTAYDMRGLFSRVRHENVNNETFVKNITSLETENLFDANWIVEGRRKPR